MMGWLRSRLTETRKANDYTDLVINQLHAVATGSGSVRQSGVYASCLHMLESAASSAELEGKFSASLQPRLGGIVKEMVHSGQSAFELVIDSSGRLELQAVQITDVLRLGCARNLELQDRATWAAFNRDDHSTRSERV